MCRRAFASNGEMRTSRCTPISDCSSPYAFSPLISTVADLMPAPSPSSRSVIDRLIAVPLGPAQIHAQQHLGPVLALGAARARMDGHDGALRIVRAARAASPVSSFSSRSAKVFISRSRSAVTFSPSRASSNSVSRSDVRRDTSSASAIDCSSRLRSCITFWLFRADSRNPDRKSAARSWLAGLSCRARQR